MRHQSLDFITDEQEANLRTLAAYLLTLPADYPDFEMNDFAADDSDPRDVSCGTAACAVGHGPMAGVDPGDETDWFEYSYCAFIEEGKSLSSRAWQWCFGGAWSRSDNTVHGAAKRILWLLDSGLPSNASEQRFGVEPLCYTDMVTA